MGPEPPEGTYFPDPEIYQAYPRSNTFVETEKKIVKRLTKRYRKELEYERGKQQSDDMSAQYTAVDELNEYHLRQAAHCADMCRIFSRKFDDYSTELFKLYSAAAKIHWEFANSTGYFSCRTDESQLHMTSIYDAKLNNNALREAIGKTDE